MEKRKILIVDDDREFLEELKETLVLSDYEPIAVNDPKAALDTARSTRPDVIVLDLKMDDIDGFHLAELLKKSPETAPIPIIAMTGFFLKERRSSLLTSCGMETCLKKPFNPLDVISKIETILDKKKRA